MRCVGERSVAPARSFVAPCRIFGVVMCFGGGVKAWLVATAASTAMRMLLPASRVQSQLCVQGLLADQVRNYASCALLNCNARAIITNRSVADGPVTSLSLALVRYCASANSPGEASKMAETPLERSRSVTLGRQENPPHLLSHRGTGLLSSVLLAAAKATQGSDLRRNGAAGVLLRLPGVITGSHNTQP